MIGVVATSIMGFCCVHHLTDQPCKCPGLTHGFNAFVGGLGCAIALITNLSVVSNTDLKNPVVASRSPFTDLVLMAATNPSSTARVSAEHQLSAECLTCSAAGNQSRLDSAVNSRPVEIRRAITMQPSDSHLLDPPDQVSRVFKIFTKDVA
jgi:hypothetical protein